MALFLNAGVLSSPSCTIGDYKIEWKLNSTSGDIVFISGEGTDITLQSQHPITNEVVSSGNLYPVINYVYINGNKVTSSYEIGEFFSPDLIGCLGFVVIDDINCSTISGGDSVYNFGIIYNNTTTNQQDKDRTFFYKIGPTTEYVAWLLLAQTIADGIQISYCTASDPVGVLIDNYIFGSESSSGIQLVPDFSPVSYPTNPRIIHYITNLEYTELRQITILSGFTYAAGDYLKVKIIGSVLDPTNNNTNWEIKLTCLDTFDKTFHSRNLSRIDTGITPVMTFDGGLCRYYLDYKTLEVAQDPRIGTSFDILKYLCVPARYYSPQAGGGMGGILMNADNARVTIPYRISSYLYTQWLGNCRNLTLGDITYVENTVGNFKVTLPNSTEYNKMVSDIAATQASSFFVAATTALVTEKEYYHGYVINVPEAISCGDTISNHYVAIHWTSVITYDSINRIIEFTMPLVTNQYPGPASCTSLYTGIDNGVIFMNDSSNAVLSYDTVIAFADYVGYTFVYQDPQLYNMLEQIMHYKIPTLIHDHIISPAELTALGFCLEGNYWWFYKQYDRVTFTDFSTHETRLENWTLERQIRLETGICVDTAYELVYEQVPTTTTTTTI